MRRVFEESSDGIVITDPRGVIVDVNGGFVRTSGYTRGELIGKNPNIMKSGVHGEEFYSEMWSTIDAKGVWHGEIWDRKKSGELYAKALSIFAIKDAQGKISNYVGIHQDITERKQTEARLEHLAHYDTLTELPNRVLFLDRLNGAMERALRNDQQVAVMLLDLDRFKTINDTLGHRKGDRLLMSVARRLREVVRKSDTVARLGGDEFTVVLPDVNVSQAGAAVARKILEAFEEPFYADGHQIYSSTSIGIAMFPFDGKDMDTLMTAADTAMYHAKNSGRNQYRFYSADMHERALERLKLETELRGSVSRGEFELLYQPKVSVVGGEITGVEALLRWDRPKVGLVRPAEFIDLADETGMISKIGDIVLRKACNQAKEWLERGKPTKVWVNLCAQQFSRKKLVDDLSRALDESGIPPYLLGLEITESVMMEEPVKAAETLSSFKELGMSIAVDDFGTGYSSLAYLKKLPLDTLKIPREFVRNVSFDSDDRAIIEAIAAMARSMGLSVVAEGVETVVQLEECRMLGCDEAQGYLFSRPVTGEGAWELISSRRLNGSIGG